MESLQHQHRRWIVLRTRPSRETYAQENVSALGFECYLPRILERQSRNGQKVSIAAPLFPTYLFVLAERWRVLLTTFGVVSVIMRGSEPDCIPNRIIADLRQRETPDGLIELPKPKQGIALHSKVRILKGPFRDHVGIVAGMRDHQRVRILLDFLGRKTDILIASADLQIEAA